MRTYATRSVSAGVEGEDISLTPLMVFFIARGYVTWLAEKKSVEAGELRIAIGADSRLSGLTMRCAASLTLPYLCTLTLRVLLSAKISAAANIMPSMHNGTCCTSASVRRAALSQHVKVHLWHTHARAVFPLSKERCSASFEAGAASLGARVSNCGLATTPAMFFACIASGHSYSGGVMITASHLPFNRNGMKFFTSAGGARRAQRASEQAPGSMLALRVWLDVG